MAEQQSALPFVFTLSAAVVGSIIVVAPFVWSRLQIDPRPLRDYVDELPEFAIAMVAAIGPAVMIQQSYSLICYELLICALFAWTVVGKTSIRARDRKIEHRHRLNSYLRDAEQFDTQIWSIKVDSGTPGWRTNSRVEMAPYEQASLMAENLYRVSLARPYRTFVRTLTEDRVAIPDGMENFMDEIERELHISSDQSRFIAHIEDLWHYNVKLKDSIRNAT